MEARMKRFTQEITKVAIELTGNDMATLRRTDFLSRSWEIGEDGSYDKPTRLDIDIKVVP